MNYEGDAGHRELVAFKRWTMQDKTRIAAACSLVRFQNRNQYGRQVQGMVTAIGEDRKNKGVCARQSAQTRRKHRRHLILVSRTFGAQKHNALSDGKHVLQPVTHFLSQERLRFQRRAQSVLAPLHLKGNADKGSEFSRHSASPLSKWPSSLDTTQRVPRGSGPSMKRGTRRTSGKMTPVSAIHW